MGCSKRRCAVLACCCAVLLALGRCQALPAEEAARLPRAAADAVGMQAERLDEIGPAVQAAIEAGEMPGCVVLIARHGKVAYLEAFGHRQLEPEKVAMTTDTVFDLASLTKPVATATSVMLLVDDGQLALDDPVAKHLPEFAAADKEHVTVLQLLTHQGGLIADNHLRDYADGPELARRRLLQLKLAYPPGERFVYSDVGFLVLGELVQKKTGVGLDEFFDKRVCQPLGLKDTCFRPGESLRKRCAPCEQREGKWIHGEVHDPRSHALGGVAGHAGLFSTADDLAIFAQLLLEKGQRDGRQILKAENVTALTTPRRVPRGLRTAGWDMQTGYSINRGQGLSALAFGHGGFTGTSLWIDPELDLTVIFLSNRLHPDGKGSVNRLAGKIATMAAAACAPPGDE